MNINDATAADMAADYLMDAYEIDYDEAISMMMSNPELLTPLFGLQILAHYLNKSLQRQERCK